MRFTLTTFAIAVALLGGAPVIGEAGEGSRERSVASADSRTRAPEAGAATRRTDDRAAIVDGEPLVFGRRAGTGSNAIRPIGTLPPGAETEPIAIGHGGLVVLATGDSQQPQGSLPRGVTLLAVSDSSPGASARGPGIKTLSVTSTGSGR